MLTILVCLGFLYYIEKNSYLQDGMILVPGNHLLRPNGNRPIHVKSFLLDKNLVTVREFDEFAKATEYITEAEKFGNAGVFMAGQGWTIVEGANYLFPFGKDHPAAPWDHPVTQVSWNDANAYALWKGKRLPTQWEWELAARNGNLNDLLYSWGDEVMVNGKYKANTWQGSFPSFNTAEDGYPLTSPVGAFGENDLGFTDMGGNVWQWCQDEIDPTPYEADFDPGKRKVLRGGSFLCDPMVCHGFSINGSASSTVESSMVHIGFRCAKDL